MVTWWKTTNHAVINVSTAIFPSPSLWAVTTISSKGICQTCCSSMTWTGVTLINKLANRTCITKCCLTCKNFDQSICQVIMKAKLYHSTDARTPFNWFVYKKCNYEYSTEVVVVVVAVVNGHATQLHVQVYVTAWYKKCFYDFGDFHHSMLSLTIPIQDSIKYIIRH